MSTPKHWFLVGLFCIGSVVFVAYQYGLFNEELTAAVTTPWAETTGDLAEEGLALGDESSSPLETRREELIRPMDPQATDPDIQSMANQFYDAPTAAKAALVIDSIIVDEENEAFVMFMKASLGMACHDRQRHISGSDKQRYFAKRLAAYCDSYSVNQDELREAELWNVEFTMRLADAIEQHMVGMTMEQQEDYLLYWVKQASNALELQALMSVIGGSYYSARATDRVYESQIHRLGQGPEYGGEQGADIQRSALLLMQCTEFVNCDPDSHLTLSECFMRQVCEPGWSLQDLIYNTHSPLENEQILAVLGTFYQVRNG